MFSKATLVVFTSANEWADGRNVRNGTINHNKVMSHLEIVFISRGFGSVKIASS